MKKPYVKKIKTIKGITVWLVDGQYIRNNINIEFTNYSQNYQFDFIPKNEFWIDSYSNKHELNFFIDAMINMKELKAKHYNHKEAIRIAGNKESKNRKKQKIMKIYSKLISENNIKEVIYIQDLINFDEYTTKVFLVNGKTVRDLYYLDFVQGGNDKVYSFIPKNEIWIEDCINPKEIPYIILHEAHERYLMKHKKLNYDSAHTLASKMELKYRKNSKGITEKIHCEIKKY